MLFEDWTRRRTTKTRQRGNIHLLGSSWWVTNRGLCLQFRDTDTDQELLPKVKKGGKYETAFLTMDEDEARKLAGMALAFLLRMQQPHNPYKGFDSYQVEAQAALEQLLAPAGEEAAP